jgi:cytochrome c biogenesis protein CcdA
MTARKVTDPIRQLSPIRVAPLGELNAYTVHEHELDIIAAGSPATLAFNFAVSLVSIGVSFVLTLTTTTINSNRLFIVYVNICIVYLLAGVIMFAYWLKTRSSVSHTVAEIKSRLIVATPVQQAPPVDSTSG